MRRFGCPILQCLPSIRPATSAPNRPPWTTAARGFHRAGRPGALPIAGQNQVLNFFAREFLRLQREWEVTLDERLERSTRQNLEWIEPRFEVTSSGVQWFDLRIDYQSAGGERFAPTEIQRLLLSGQGHTRLKNGKFALIDTGAVGELQETLLDCARTTCHRLSSQEYPGGIYRDHVAAASRLEIAGAAGVARARQTIKRRGRPGMPAPGRLGIGAAPLSEKRRGVVPFPPAERFWRHSGG